MTDVNPDFYVEATGFGGRVHAGDQEGEVEGVVAKITDAAFSAVAFRRAKVRSLSSPSGWKWADETNCGTHPDLNAAAEAVHGAYVGEGRKG